MISSKIKVNIVSEKVKSHVIKVTFWDRKSNLWWIKLKLCFFISKFVFVFQKFDFIPAKGKKERQTSFWDFLDMVTLKLGQQFFIIFHFTLPESLQIKSEKLWDKKNSFQIESLKNERYSWNYEKKVNYLDKKINIVRE